MGMYNSWSSYNYYTDWADIRWKSIDEGLGLVNKQAQNTYDGSYYYYYSYYTYTANQNYWYDTFTDNTQEGTSCYSYSRQQTYSQYTTNYKCKHVSEEFTITAKQFNGMICGLAILGVFIGILSFASTEVVVLVIRNKKQEKAIGEARKQANQRVCQGQATFYEHVGNRESVDGF